jgi:hypothetical protein
MTPRAGVPESREAGRHGATATKEVTEMPVWAWVLLIILVVLLLTGGIGYGRR